MTKAFKILAGLTALAMAGFIGYCVYLFSEKNKKRTANARAARWQPKETEQEDEDEDEDDASPEKEAEQAIKNILSNGN